MGNFKELTELAKELAVLASEIGDSWQKITPNLEGYNADNSNHQSAQIFDIRVSLFHPVQFEFTEAQFNSLDETLKLAKKELTAYKKARVQKSKQLAEQEKQDRIAELERKLKHLKGEPVGASDDTK